MSSVETPTRIPLAVTVSGKSTEDQQRYAKKRAQDWALPFVPRRYKEALAGLVEEKAEALLVFEHEDLALVDQDGTLRFSPGMAFLRVKQIDAGVLEDKLVRVAELMPGEAVLDCTLGLAGDALVTARTVAPSGKVVGLEKSMALFALVEEGLRHHPVGPRSCSIEVVHADHLEYLRAQPTRSFDCVLFDPMFGRPGLSSGSFDSLRRYADYGELTAEAISEAQRVARRCVVLKGSRYSRDFKKHGLRAEPSRAQSRVIWAKLPAR